MAKKSFKYIILNILTFGHLSRKAKKIAKEQEAKKNTELKLNTMALPDLEKLSSALGGRENIVSASSTISTVKFVLTDPNKINLDVLKEIAAKGVIKTADGVTIVVGDCATELAKQFNNKGQEVNS